MLLKLGKGSTTVTPVLLKREGGAYTTQASGTAFTMASGDTVRCVIADDPGNSALQELKVYVAGTLRLTTTKIDDEWSSGEAGVAVLAHASGTLSFDNFKVGYDDNADGDIADADDDIQIDDDFSSNVLTLVHDHAGNLTDDGVLLYAYDAWNRLVAARRRVDAQTPVVAYEYDGLNRRIRKQVDNSGVGVVPGSDAGGIDGIQAGNLNEHYYYAGWRVIEERDNSANTLAQTVYGTEYIDAPVCRDRNTDVTAGGSPDDDCLDSGGSARYFYHQDANFRVVAMTDESAAVVERYDYDAYGEPRVYAGVSGSAESGALRMASAIGNPYMHQGLRWDNETGLHENRYRSLHSRLGRFMQRDPQRFKDSLNMHQYVRSRPTLLADANGLLAQATPDIDCVLIAAVSVGTFYWDCIYDCGGQLFYYTAGDNTGCNPKMPRGKLKPYEQEIPEDAWRPDEVISRRPVPVPVVVPSGPSVGEVVLGGCILVGAVVLCAIIAPEVTAVAALCGLAGAAQASPVAPGAPQSPDESPDIPEPWWPRGGIDDR